MTIGIPYRLDLYYGEIRLPYGWFLTENALRREHGYPMRLTHWWEMNRDEILNWGEE